MRGRSWNWNWMVVLLLLAGWTSGCSIAGKYTYIDNSDLENEDYFVYSVEVLQIRYGKEFFVIPEACPCADWKNAKGSWDPASGEIVFSFENDEGHFRRAAGMMKEQNCGFITMDDNSLYARSQVATFDMLPLDWLKTITAFILRASRAVANDGTRILQPGLGNMYYRGMWPRDSFFGILGGLDLLPDIEEMRNASFWLLSASRDVDGAMPDHRELSGLVHYGQTGCDDDVAGCLDLDSGPFAVKLASVFVLNDTVTPREERVQYFKGLRHKLVGGMMATPVDSGLTDADADKSQMGGLGFNVGYGFQDTVKLTGHSLYTSVLYWEASRLLASMIEFVDPDGRDQDWLDIKRNFEGQARGVAEHISELWDPEVGLFRASDGVEKDRHDIWGSAYAGHVGLASEEQAARIFDFLSSNRARVFFEGQVRQLPFPQQWEAMNEANSAATTAPRRRYQNGGYWATPHNHVLPFLGRYDPQLACSLLYETIASFRSHGVNEWVGPFWPHASVGAQGYVASAANTYSAAKQLDCGALSWVDAGTSRARDQAKGDWRPLKQVF